MNRSRTIDQDSWQYTDWTEEPPKPVSLWNRTTSKSNLRTAIVLSPILVLVVAAAVMMARGSDSAGLYFVEMLPIAGALSAVALLTVSRGGKSGADVRDLMDLPQTVPQYPVQVLYKVGNTPYGRDVGVLTFAGPLLHFQGRRSRFGFANAVVTKVLADLKRKPGDAHLHLRFRGGGLSVQILCFDSTPGIGAGFQAKFAQELSHWRSSDLTGHSTSVLPPLQAESRYVRRARAAAVAALIPTVALVLVATLDWSVFGPGTAGLPIALFLIILCSVPLYAALPRIIDLKLLRTVHETSCAGRAGLDRSAPEEQHQKLSL